MCQVTKVYLLYLAVASIHNSTGKIEFCQLQLAKTITNICIDKAITVDCIQNTLRDYNMLFHAH